MSAARLPGHRRLPGRAPSPSGQPLPGLPCFLFAGAPSGGPLPSAPNCLRNVAGAALPLGRCGPPPAWLYQPVKRRACWNAGGIGSGGSIGSAGSKHCSGGGWLPGPPQGNCCACLCVLPQPNGCRSPCLPHQLLRLPPQPWPCSIGAPLHDSSCCAYKGTTHPSCKANEAGTAAGQRHRSVAHRTFCLPALASARLSCN